MTIRSRDLFTGKLSKYFFDRADEIEAIAETYKSGDVIPYAQMMEEADRLRRWGEMYKQNEDTIEQQMRDPEESGESE